MAVSKFCKTWAVWDFFFILTPIDARIQGIQFEDVEETWRLSITIVVVLVVIVVVIVLAVLVAVFVVVDSAAAGGLRWCLVV